MNQIKMKDEEYYIIKMLGKGGFGKVFEVKCGENNYALKVEIIQNNNQVGLEKEKQVLSYINTIY